jgi:hypothetical protein
MFLIAGISIELIFGEKPANVLLVFSICIKKIEIYLKKSIKMTTFALC